MPMIEGIGLFEDGTKNIIRSVYNYMERQGLVWEGENRGGCEGPYQGGKGFLLWCVPVEWCVFLDTAGKGVNNVGIVFNNALVKIAEAEKRLNLFECLWDGPVGNGFHFD